MTRLILSIVGALALLTACKPNYKQEYRGNTPLRIRNLTAHTVTSVHLVPEMANHASDNWLAQPIMPGGEITFTIKNGGYWFKARGTAGPIKIDTGTSMNSAFGKLIVIDGQKELVLFDRNTNPVETAASGSRLTFSFDTAPASDVPAPAPAPVEPAPSEPAPPADEAAPADSAAP